MWRQSSLFFTYVVGVLAIEGKGKPCGAEASPHLLHHNPWLVYIEYYRHQHLTEIRCAGTLISSKHVVTAAHCVKKTRFSHLVARLGEYDTRTEQDCLRGLCADPLKKIAVSKIIAHSGYDGRQHDIAVLVLAEDAPYTDFIRPVCLPSGDLDPTATFTASGWGVIPFDGHYSDTKKILLLPNWGIAECKAAYSSIDLPDGIICAGGEEGVDTCNGDSGGPLAWVRYRIELWGVTSFGNTHCGTKDSPGIYTKVIDYLDWIQEVSASN